MNKVIQINLGGIVFHVDEDAYQVLKNYLDQIHAHFSNSEGYSEITGDIESRLAEIFQETMAGRQVVNSDDVNQAIKVMGTPEDFGAEPQTKTKSENRKSSTGSTNAKRLMRNKEDGVLGGVCSGISAYFGMEDPIWLRIAFLIAFFIFGTGFLLYIILWIVMPEAKTTADKLSMRGENPNISNIAKMVEDGGRAMSDKIKELREDFEKKETGSHIRTFIESFFDRLREVISAIISALGKLGKPLLLLIIGICLLATFAAFLGVGSVSYFGAPVLNYIVPNHHINATIAGINLFFLAAIPLASLIMMFMHIIFKTNQPQYWRWGMSAFWTINLISLIIIGSITGKEFQRGSKIKQSIELVDPNTDTLNLELKSSEYEDLIYQIGDLKFDQDILVSEDVDLHINQTSDPVFSLTKETESRGKNVEQAKELASQINYQMNVEKSRIVFSPDFTIKKDGVFRGQKINFYLGVPVGKFVKIHSERNNRTFFNYSAADDHYFHNDGHPITLQMKKEGLICISCEGNKNWSNVSNNLNNFSEISVSGPIDIIIEKGNEYKVLIEDEYKYKNLVKASVNGNTLFINSEDNNDDIKVKITLPQLKAFDSDNAGDAELRGFIQSDMKISQKGNAKLKANVDIEHLFINLKGEQQCTLNGKGHELTAVINGNADIDAMSFDANTARVSLFDNGSAKLNVRDTLYKKCNDDADLKIMGKPVEIKF